MGERGGGVPAAPEDTGSVGEARLRRLMDLRARGMA